MSVNSCYTCSTFSLQPARSEVITEPWCHPDISNKLLHKKSFVNSVMTNFLQLSQGQTTQLFHHQTQNNHREIVNRNCSDRDNFGPRWFGWLEETNDWNVFRERQKPFYWFWLCSIWHNTTNVSQLALDLSNLWSRAPRITHN